MPDLLAADQSPFWPTHSASAPTHTHTRAFGGHLCYGPSSTAFRQKCSDAIVLSKALLMSAMLMTESWATEVRSCPWPQCVKVVPQDKQHSWHTLGAYTDGRFQHAEDTFRVILRNSLAFGVNPCRSFGIYHEQANKQTNEHSQLYI